MHSLLPPEHKFAILVVSNVKADFPDGLRLPGGVVVLKKFPVSLDPNWRNWLGLDLPRIVDANLILLCTEGPISPQTLSISDSTNSALSDRLVEVFVMLRLMGTIEYESAFFLTGYSKGDGNFCQNYSKLAQFYNTRGCLPWMLTAADLNAAAGLATAKQSFLSTFSDLHKVRIFRGWVALSAALQQYFASDRIHGFVRALEATIHPKIGKTARQFKDRCSIFAARPEGRTAVWETLREIYAMRCDVEHLNDWDQSLSTYAPDKREDIAYWRTRQTETLACLTYARIFGDSELQRSFSTDENIAALWRAPESEIRRLFGQTFDITELKNVTKYDLTGRAHVSEWPAGWMEKLKRTHPALS